MSVHEVAKSNWKPFFETLTRTLVGKRAEVEVASLDLGDQIEAQWAPLIGIVYDSKNDLIEVALEGLDHLILGPRQVYVDFDVGGLVGLEVIDADDSRQIVKLKDSLALPAPAEAAAVR